MTQISRPFQIALAVLVLFVAVWFVALRGHSSGGESSSAPQPAATAPAQQSAPGGGTPASKGGVYHGSAPGVEGLSRAIQKARGAVAQSQQNAQQLQQKSAQASGESQTQQKGQSQRAQNQTQTQNGQAQAQSKPASGVPAMQATVEAELKQGKVVAVLFWNPKGAVDATVRRELHKARGSLHGKLAVHVARSSDVGSFGNFTHTVQVYSTPTILLINKQGGTSSLSGLTDAFSIAQAIKEVKRAK